MQTVLYVHAYIYKVMHIAVYMHAYYVLNAVHIHTHRHTNINNKLTVHYLNKISGAHKLNLITLSFYCNKIIYNDTKTSHSSLRNT